MIQLHTCVSVHCDQCDQPFGRLTRARHFRTENAAITAATTQGWRIGPDGTWWCSICAPALICQAQGHQFTPWRCPQIRNEHPAPSEYRYCRRCCVLEDRPAPQNRRDGGESR
jgi:hypothetical protein